LERCLDLGVGLSTPAGEMLANVMATFAQYERRLIGVRTKEALAVCKQQGVRSAGRPRSS
jgi:DNA invertase Pin-like site-specific DNA recombinase